MKYFAMLRMLLCLFVAGVFAMGAEDTPTTPPSDPTPGCKNQKTDCDCPKDTSGNSGSTSTGGSPSGSPKTCAKKKSIIALNMRYRHEAIDYRVNSPQASGCVPCGSASTVSGDPRTELPQVDLTRIYFPDTDLPSSLGPNWGLTWDVWLQLYAPGQIANGRPTGVPGWQVLVGQPQRTPIDFHVAVDGAGTGIFRDQVTAWFQDVRFFDAGGVLQTDPSLATAATLRLWTGESFQFEIYQESTGVWLGRPLRWLNRNGQAITMTWKYAITDPSLTNSLRAKLRIRDSVVDPYGNTFRFTYDETTTVGANYACTRIDLPNGGNVQYRYGTQLAFFGGGTMRALTGVTGANGTISTFSSVYDPGTSCIIWSKDDPAAANPTSRRGQVWFTPSTWTNPANPSDQRSQIFGRVRQITNGSGEVIFQCTVKEFTLADGSREDRTYFYDEGKLWAVPHIDGHLPKGMYVRRIGDGQPLWLYSADWSGWDKVQDDDIGSVGLGASRITSGVGNTTLFDRDPLTDLESKITYPDGSTYQVQRGAFQLPTWEQDRLGRIVTHAYDAHGNLLTLVRGAGSSAQGTWTSTYTSTGQLATATDANGNITTYTYDARNHLASIIQAKDAASDTAQGVTLFQYDTAGRLIQVTDPVGRATTYGYDLYNHVVTVGYSDGSTETATYGTGADANLVIARKDRNGNITTYGYDAAGRVILTTTAAGTPVAITESCTYLPGNNHLKSSCVRAGETTMYAYDYRLRLIGTTVIPRAGTSLTSTTAYDVIDRVRATTDPYGRRTFYGYDVNDRRTRMVRELLPNAVGISDATTSAAAAALAALARETALNPGYVIEDTVYDAEGQTLERIDGRAIAHTTEYDAQGRMTTMVEAFQAAADTAAPTFPIEAARTEFQYDPQGNRTAVIRPRSFTRNVTTGAFSPSADGVFKTTSTYSGRNLLLTMTEAAGRAEAATQSMTYYLDQRIATTTDARGQIWSTVWKECCARLGAQVSPFVTDATGTFRSVQFTDYDFYGNVTHTATARWTAATLPDCCTGIDASTPVLAEITTTYDARHRPTARTVWLVRRATVDPTNPPIAGVNGIPASEGLTTKWRYDDDLSDSIGLSNPADTDSVAPYVASLGLVAGSDGSAMVQINPAGEKMWMVADGLGRTVRAIDGNGNATTSTFDAVVANLVETSMSDALAHVTKMRADGAGRTRLMSDALGKISTMAYDANGTKRSWRDANGVGMDCLVDARNRDISCTDTQSDTTGKGYDAESNLITQTDARGFVTTSTFDARNRKTLTVDRVNGATAFAYDANSNLLTIKDADAATRGDAEITTLYGYDPRNLLILEAYRNDNPEGTFEANDTRRYAYDAASRLTSRLDQVNVTTTYGYDLAARLLSRTYSDGQGNDSFAYDAAAAS